MTTVFSEFVGFVLDVPASIAVMGRLGSVMKNVGVMNAKEKEHESKRQQAVSATSLNDLRPSTMLLKQHFALMVASICSGRCEVANVEVKRSAAP